LFSLPVHTFTADFVQCFRTVPRSAQNAVLIKRPNGQTGNMKSCTNSALEHVYLATDTFSKQVAIKPD
jgi:hypothetical protein